MEKTSKRDILATIALPYANGQLHLGHIIEAVQADIWCRVQNMVGNRCVFIAGNDAHGTAVMLSAEKNGLTAQQWVSKIHKDHVSDFGEFSIGFDNFYTTHSEENKKFSKEVYLKLRERGDIVTRVITQAYDEEKQLFLSDRYIKGECPRCGTHDQYGDNCEQCGATYSPLDLKNPVSVLSGTTPAEKESEHYFFKLENYRQFLEEWLDSGHIQSQVTNKLKEWFNEPLRDWDISRDAPYFGFQIPGHPEKYFYVWLDAPIGYIASTENLAARRDDISTAHYWAKDSKAELVHFIGKDIVYFHALFWPAMLKGTNYRLPSKINVHGYLTINGEKMSKSRGTFITAKKYLIHLNAEYLRYYFAAKLNSQVEDIDFNLEDFMARVNSDLVGKFVNLASRCAGFITKKFDGVLAAELPQSDLYNEFVQKSEDIKQLYDELNYNRCMREIMQLADKANQYIDQEKPWAMAKEEGKMPQVQAVCTQGLNLFRVMATYLKPVLPVTSKKIEDFLQAELSWQQLEAPLLAHNINPFKPLMGRITAEDLEKLRS